MIKGKDKKIEIREIVYSQDDDKSFGDIFVYEPENVEERNLGSLFIIGELKDLPRNSSYVVNLLASKIKKEFYSNTKRTSEEGLEAALSMANQTLSELAEQGNGEYVGKLSMVCGTYKDNKFYLSQVGKIKSLLVRSGQLIEIIKDEDGKPASPKRAFNNIASGELDDGDLVMFATSGLFNVFSLEKIRQLASSMDLDEFATRLQEDVEEDDNEVVSALVIEINGDKKEKIGRVAANMEEEVEIEPLDKVLGEEPYVVQETPEEEIAEIEEDMPKAATAEIIPPVAAEDSLEKKKSRGRAKKEEKMEGLAMEVQEPVQAAEGATFGSYDKEIAEESVIESAQAERAAEGNLEAAEKDAGKVSLSDIIKEYEKMENKPAEDRIIEKDKNLENIIARKESTDFQDLDEVPGEGFGKELIAKARSVVSGIRLDSVKDSVSTAAFAAADRIKIKSGRKEYTVNGSRKKFGRLSGKKMVIAGAAIIIIAVILSPKLFPKTDKAQEQKAATYQALLAEARSKFDDGETKMVSGSEQDAGRLFFDAKTLAIRVKDEYDGLDSDADAVIAKAQEEIDKIDKVVSVANPQTIATLDNGNLTNIVEIAGNLYALDGKDNAMYKVDATGGKLTQLAKAASSNKIGEANIAQNFQNQEILFADGSSVSSFGLKSASIQKLSTDIGSPFKDLTAYNRNIYVLAPTKNQIYKFQKSATGLEGKTEWLKSGDVQNAVSMAIDQNIFVLYPDGQVKKFYTGEEAVVNGSKFSLVQPIDAIVSATKIFTLNGQKNLYILEPGKGRILIFDKTSGALVKQLTGDGFTGIKDISVDSKETAVTAVMKDKVLKIGL